MGKATNLGLSFEKLVAESSRDKDRNNGAVGYLHYHDTGTCPRIYKSTSRTPKAVCPLQKWRELAFGTKEKWSLLSIF